PQGRDLDGEIVVLDGNARPCRSDQRPLRHRKSRPLDERAQHRDGTLAQRDRLGAAKQRLPLTVETKRTENVGCGHLSFLSMIQKYLGKYSWQLRDFQPAPWQKWGGDVHALDLEERASVGVSIAAGLPA